MIRVPTVLARQHDSQGCHNAWSSWPQRTDSWNGDGSWNREFGESEKDTFSPSCCVPDSKCSLSLVLTCDLRKMLRSWFENVCLTNSRAVSFLLVVGKTDPGMLSRESSSPSCYPGRAVPKYAEVPQGWVELGEGVGRRKLVEKRICVWPWRIRSCQAGWIAATHFLQQSYQVHKAECKHKKLS